MAIDVHPITVRYTKDRQAGRATYHPEWSARLPWVTYIDGTAGAHFASLDECDRYFGRKGFTTRQSA